MTKRAQLNNAELQSSRPRGRHSSRTLSARIAWPAKTSRDDHQHDLQRNGRRLHHRRKRHCLHGRGQRHPRHRNGGVVFRPKAKSVTHVPGARPVTYVSGRSSQYPRRRSLESRQREILTALHWGSPRRFVPGDLAESAAAPAPRRESARKRPSNTGQPASRRRNPFGAQGQLFIRRRHPARHASAPRRHCALQPSLYQDPARWCTIYAPARPQSHRAVPCNHRPTSVGESRRSADVGGRKPRRSNSSSLSSNGKGMGRACVQPGFHAAGDQLVDPRSSESSETRPEDRPICHRFG